MFFKILLALAIFAGFAGVMIWADFRTTRGTYRRAGAQMDCIGTVLATVGERLGLQLGAIPLVIGHPVPPAPMLHGAHRGYEMIISPDYPGTFGLDLDGGDLFIRVPWVIRILGADPVDYKHFPVAPKASYASNDEVVEAWECQKLRAGGKVYARAVAGLEAVISSLLDPARRPLRVTRLEKLPHQLQAVVEYVKPPKVKFRGYSFRMPTNPEDLQHIISDLIDIADALPLKDYD